MIEPLTTLISYALIQNDCIRQACEEVTMLPPQEKYGYTLFAIGVSAIIGTIGVLYRMRNNNYR